MFWGPVKFLHMTGISARIGGDRHVEVSPLAPICSQPVGGGLGADE